MVKRENNLTHMRKTYSDNAQFSRKFIHTKILFKNFQRKTYLKIIIMREELCYLPEQIR